MGSVTLPLNGVLKSTGMLSGPVEIDPAHPLARHVVGAWHMRNMEVVSLVGSLSSSNGLKSGVNSARFNSSGDNPHYITNLDIRAYENSTIVCDFYPTNISTNILFWQGVSTANGLGAEGEYHAHMQSTPHMGMWIGTGLANSWNQNGTGYTPKLNQWNASVNVIENLSGGAATVAKMWFNGIQMVLSFNGGTFTTNAASWTNKLQFGKPGANTRNFIGNHSFMAVLGIAVPEEVGRSLSQNPYQLLRSKIRPALSFTLDEFALASVDTDNDIFHGQTGVVILPSSGSVFAGSGNIVTITDGSITVTQTVTAESTSSITITVDLTGLTPGAGTLCVLRPRIVV